ncbi:MAG: M15 family metallopeptidase [Leptolyngbyaceae cyanobacterium CSU_1_3]|nr:M15 family metallopeptidase [Leptolyngbyaceae cyanobacterium CSU_1_3]
MKPYQHVAIVECNEPLIAIPTGFFAFVSPHAYQQLGAPYGDKSPFYLRQGVLDRLLVAQQTLQQTHPGWQIQIFDAYRPVAVQQFMVDYTFSQLAQAEGRNPDTLTEAQTQALLHTVYQFWAVPNVDPKMPPPHSTGAAIDITLVNATGAVIDMGSPIDEISDRSYPNHFAASLNPSEQGYHQHRQLLNQVMAIAGFKRHWNEWWHFSYGDQIWAWLTHQQGEAAIAKYGKI